MVKNKNLRIGQQKSLGCFEDVEFSTEFCLPFSFADCCTHSLVTVDHNVSSQIENNAKHLANIVLLY